MALADPWLEIGSFELRAPVITTIVEDMQLDDGIYSGQMRNFKKHGKGMILFISGNTYQGTWVDDKMEGVGLYTWYSWKGQKSYEGQFLENKKHGIGTFTTSSEIFQGHWVNDMRHGFGTLITKDEVIEGWWLNDKLKMRI